MEPGMYVGKVGSDIHDFIAWTKVGHMMHTLTINGKEYDQLKSFEVTHTKNFLGNHIEIRGSDNSRNVFYNWAEAQEWLVLNRYIKTHREEPPKDKVPCDCKSGASCGGTGFKPFAPQGYAAWSNMSAAIQAASTWDMRVTGDGTYWIAPPGTSTDSMFGWRRISLAQIERDPLGVVWVSFPEVGYRRKVRTVHGTMKKENSDMNQIEALQAQAEMLNKQIADEMLRKAERDAALSMEPESDDDTQAVIYWAENFGREDGPYYTYVAVKVRNNTWYVTGKQTQPFTWEQMIDKYHSLRHGDFWIAGEWLRANG